MRQSKAMAIQRKPVIVRKFTRDWFAGHAEASFSSLASDVEILDQSGKVRRINWEQVKWVCFVRDFPSSNADQQNPERLLQKKFVVRPRTAGLWIRLTLNDGDELEGLAANDRSLIDGVGLLLTPPDTRSNTQRIFVPRHAIQKMEVVALIGSPSNRRVVRTTTEQRELFPAP